MKKILVFLSLILFSSTQLQAQKVGLVLSGGGAKGITHIGVIKALEENNIPIDYIAGTSMGAIVGGLYAMGLTPDQMIDILKSNDFKYWSTGEIQSDNVYYYRNADPKPSFVDFRLKINDLDSFDLKDYLLPTNLVSPRQMNYALVPLFAQANALAGGDFNKLMVPFACVASDIYNKEAVIFRSGVLGDAIRASMTFPFMFKPIIIDNRLLFDGGIYNNFPVDVMRDDFKPDIMIGSVVSNNPRKPDEHNLVMQIENMIMSKTDYTITEKEGILLKFDLSNVNTFDFSKIDQLVKIGYDEVMKNIDEIKARIPRRISTEELTEKRKKFRDGFPPLKFKKIEVEGVDSLQKIYIEKIFNYNNKVFNLNEFKEAYFKLISDDKISEVIPHAIYNPKTGYFDLNLDVTTQNQLKVMLGGNISSSTSNQAYFGVSYQNLGEYAQTDYVDAQFGRIYNGLGLGTRIEVPTEKNWYLKLGVILHKFDYFEGNRLFYEDNRTSYFNQYEGYSKLSIGFPLTMKGRMEFGIGYGALSDNYLQYKDLTGLNSKNDKSIFSLGNAFAKIDSYTLNDIMYPTKGFRYSTSLQLFGGEENFKSGTDPALNVSDRMDLWLQYRAKMDRYYPLASNFTLGAFAELAITTRKLLQNYTVNLIQAPSFQPTPFTRTVFNDAFSANQFLAVGLKPIYQINKQLHIRSEAYWFIPYKTFIRQSDNTPAYSGTFRSSQFMSETSLVFNFKIASAAFFANYSSSPGQWNLGINIGFLLFNPKFTE
ncbi:MAG: patatin-like phospholipase family protein [Paludibacter sp.]|nr:patatin-like phospholipase family protein [Paludibacter sp.]